MIRRLAHEPLGWRPTVLEVVVRRYRCADCGHVWRQDTSAAAEPRAKLSRTGLRWALEGIVVAHLTVARVAEGLGVAWDTANNAVLAEGNRLLINDPTRFEVSAYSSECTTEYEVVCTTAQATSVSRSMAWRRFLSR